MTNNCKETNTIVDQDMRSRYLRAESLEHETYVDSMVLNSKVYPHWIGDSHCFWYIRKKRKDNGLIKEPNKEFRVVNSESATNNAAFDHNLLAHALAKASQRDVNPNNLPISIIELALSPCRVTFTAFNQHWLFDAVKESCEKISVPPKPLRRNQP